MLAGREHAAGAQRALDRVVRLRDVGAAGVAHDDLPPYFVAGAIFGGFAMVLLLLIPSRELCAGDEGPGDDASHGEHGEDSAGDGA